MFGCRHDVWKRFDIGFDTGWCCARCKHEQSDPVCRCGTRARWRDVGETAEFSCMHGRCDFAKSVRLSAEYLNGSGTGGA